MISKDGKSTTQRSLLYREERADLRFRFDDLLGASTDYSSLLSIYAVERFPSVEVSSFSLSFSPLFSLIVLFHHPNLVLPDIRLIHPVPPFL